MSRLKEFTLGVDVDKERKTINLSDDADPLTPIQGNSTELYDDNEFSNFDSVIDSNDDDIGESDNVSDESSVSFELYDDAFVREKVISQIKQEQLITTINIDDNNNNNSNNNNNESQDINISDFLLKYYKYRDLGDLSSGLGELIKGIDNELIELVNENYLNFIDLGTSIDGSLDLIHDIKIDLSEYLKNLKLSNEMIVKDKNKLNRLQNSRSKLISLKSIAKRIITLNEMIECFDKLCSKFDSNEESTDMLKELVGLYFGIDRMFTKLTSQVNDAKLKVLIDTGILLNLDKKMNGLKLEFKSLLNMYLNHLRKCNRTNEDIFEIFKLYQLMDCVEDFKQNL